MAVNRFLRTFPRRLRAIQADLVHVGDPYLAPLADYREDVVVTIADMGKLTTRWYPRASSFIHNLNLRSVARARGVVCPTEYVRQEVLRHLPISGEKVAVVPPHSALPLGRVREPPAPPTDGSPWNLLCVSSDRPHKNLDLFLRLLKAAGPRFRGTLVSRLTNRTSRRIHELGLDRSLTRLHDVEDMAQVYRDAHVLVFPSLFEGFGLPLLEGMGQGLPLVASGVTSIPEVVGGAGMLLDPATPDAWRAAIEQLTDASVYREYSRRGWERAQGYTPHRTGEALRDAYRMFFGDAFGQRSGA